MLLVAIKVTIHKLRMDNIGLVNNMCNIIDSLCQTIIIVCSVHVSRSSYN